MRTPLPRAFSLIELIAVMGILAALVGMLAPVIASVREKADSVTCVNNLRQIGVTALLYAGENNQTFPVVEPWPSEPIYQPEDQARTLLDVLGPYGLTEKGLTCRRDVLGPDYLDQEGSSYQWCPMSSNQKITAPSMVWRGGANDEVSLARIFMAFDYSNVHRNTANILFADGHVAAGN